MKNGKGQAVPLRDPKIRGPKSPGNALSITQSDRGRAGNKDGAARERARPGNCDRAAAGLWRRDLSARAENIRADDPSEGSGQGFEHALSHAAPALPRRFRRVRANRAEQLPGQSRLLVRAHRQGPERSRVLEPAERTCGNTATRCEKFTRSTSGGLPIAAAGSNAADRNCATPTRRRRHLEINRLTGRHQRRGQANALRAYPCRVCGGWHLTKASQQENRKWKLTDEPTRKMMSRGDSRSWTSPSANWQWTRRCGRISNFIGVIDAHERGEYADATDPAIDNAADYSALEAVVI